MVVGQMITMAVLRVDGTVVELRLGCGLPSARTAVFAVGQYITHTTLADSACKMALATARPLQTSAVSGARGQAVSPRSPQDGGASSQEQKGKRATRKVKRFDAMRVPRRAVLCRFLGLCGTMWPQRHFDAA